MRPNYHMYSAQNLSLITAADNLNKSCYAYSNSSPDSIIDHGSNSLMYSNLFHIHTKSAHYANMVLGLKGKFNQETYMLFHAITDAYSAMCRTEICRKTCAQIGNRPKAAPSLQYRPAGTARVRVQTGQILERQQATGSVALAESDWSTNQNMVPESSHEMEETAYVPLEDRAAPRHLWSSIFAGSSSSSSWSVWTFSTTTIAIFVGFL